MKTMSNTGALRIDDICRTERYYTATLLPIILFHNSFEGLKSFVELLKEKNVTQTDNNGNISPIDIVSPNEKIEIVTEMDIVRDVKYYSNWIIGLKDITIVGSESLRPDVVIIIGRSLIVIEGKYFDNSSSATNVSKIRNQLTNQQNVIKNILMKFPGYDIQSYSHIFLSPSYGYSTDDIGCNGIINWKDISNLSKKVLGDKHYVTERLMESNNLYSYVIGEKSANSKVKNYCGKYKIGEIIKKHDNGEDLLIGFTGGLSKLRSISKDKIQSHDFKWDYRLKPVGTKIPVNWILISKFFDTIKELHPYLFTK
ncbi:MAG: hypothetical protein GX031_01040 [Candidatus Riflebacteria bacterium]|nr:hypothetical protein [Candidatus Riflebacteria bacterium]